MKKPLVPQGVCLDASGQVNQYRWPIYALVAPDKRGQGIPVAYLITSSLAATPVTKFLEVLYDVDKKHFKPNIVMIDASLVEVEGIREYVNAVNAGREDGLERAEQSDYKVQIRICFFHLMQAWERWLKRSENKVLPESQKDVLTLVRQMKLSTTPQQYYGLLDKLKAITAKRKLPAVMKYYEKQLQWGKYVACFF